MSGCARPRTTGARWDRARDPARDARGSVWTDEGAARICGVGRKQAQAAAAQRGQRTSLSSLCWWPQLTTVAGCENWRQPDEAVKFHYPSNGDGCRRKSAKGPARCTHQGFALEMYQHSVLNSPTPIFRTRAVMMAVVGVAAVAAAAVALTADGGGGRGGCSSTAAVAAAAVEVRGERVRESNAAVSTLVAGRLEENANLSVACERSSTIRRRARLRQLQGHCRSVIREGPPKRAHPILGTTPVETSVPQAAATRALSSASGQQCRAPQFAPACTKVEHQRYDSEHLQPETRPPRRGWQERWRR